MLMYALFGGLFVAIQLVIRYKLMQVGKAKLWPNCILVLIANAAIMFSVAWAYGSIMEYETQAAFMGIVMFGGVGVVFAIIAYRVISKSPKAEKAVSAEPAEAK